QRLERPDPLASLRVAVPQAAAEGTVENDTTILAVPLRPAAEVLEARVGAEGEGDSGDQKELRVTEEILETAEIGGMQEGARGRLCSPIREAGMAGRIERQSVDAGLACDRRL